MPPDLIARGNAQSCAKFLPWGEFKCLTAPALALLSRPSHGNALRDWRARCRAETQRWGVSRGHVAFAATGEPALHDRLSCVQKRRAISLTCSATGAYISRIGSTISEAVSSAVPPSTGGWGAYSAASIISCAQGRPRNRSTMVMAKSSPADTPAPVITLPSVTTRSLTGTAPNSLSRLRTAQCDVARLRPAAATPYRRS